jgi:hypothetical protein
VIPFPELADSVNESSSRGPVWSSARLKPDISAPGSSIDSARAGFGSDPVSMTGTSMSAPHVAGAAALVREARPDWPVVDIKAVLMNTARTPMQTTNGAAYPESRVGSGRLAVDAALSSPVVAKSELRPREVSLSFGVILAESMLVRTQVVELRNHGWMDITYQVRGSNTLTQPGARMVPGVAQIVVPARGTARVPVMFEVDPAGLVADADDASPVRYGEWPRYGLPEISGQVWFHGGPVDLHVPWHAVARSVMRGRAGASLAGAPLGDPVVMPTPTGGPGGHRMPLVGVFQQGFQQTSVGFTDDRAWTDVVAAGAASDFARVGSVEGMRVSFAVVTAGAWPSPMRRFVTLDVEIDRDSNGVADVILSNGNLAAVEANDLGSETASNDALVTAVDRRGGAALEVGGFWNGLPPDVRDVAPFYNSVVVLSATGRQLGLAGSNPTLRYRVVTRGRYNETTPWIQLSPTRLLVDGAAHGIEGSPWQDHGMGVRATIRRQHAVAAGQNAQGQIPALLVHLHNVSGMQAEVIRFDLDRWDVDGDRLPDAWELERLGNLAGTWTTDRDGDGISDGDEWWAGTDPLDPASQLRLGFVRWEDRTLQWRSLPGRRYVVLRSRAMDGPYSPWRAGVEADSETTTLTDPEVMSGTATWFYRLQIQGP